MTIYEALRGINAYPIPTRTLDEICTRRGLDGAAEAAVADLTSSTFNLAKADVLVWLSYAPNVSQGGQSYNFTDEQREKFRQEAAALLDEFGEDEQLRTRYGYKGSRL